jgi:hypothetical protein
VVQEDDGEICGRGELTVTPRVAGSSHVIVTLVAQFPRPGNYEVTMTLRDVSVPDSAVIERLSLPLKIAQNLP